MGYNARKNLGSPNEVLISIRISKEHEKFLKKMRLIYGLNSSAFIRKLLDRAIVDDISKECEGYFDADF